MAIRRKKLPDKLQMNEIDNLRMKLSEKLQMNNADNSRKKHPDKLQMNNINNLRIINYERKQKMIIKTKEQNKAKKWKGQFIKMDPEEDLLRSFVLYVNQRKP
jgi:hypothetical protein